MKIVFFSVLLLFMANASAEPLPEAIPMDEAESGFYETTARYCSAFYDIHHQTGGVFVEYSSRGTGGRCANDGEVLTMWAKDPEKAHWVKTFTNGSVCDFVFFAPKRVYVVCKNWKGEAYQGPMIYRWASAWRR